jgi:hypothetical protein
MLSSQTNVEQRWAGLLLTEPGSQDHTHKQRLFIHEHESAPIIRDDLRHDSKPYSDDRPQKHNKGAPASKDLNAGTAQSVVVVRV